MKKTKPITVLSLLRARRVTYPMWIACLLAGSMFKQVELEYQFDKLVWLIAKEMAQEESKG